jgi:preprotein translocase subunit YajC
MVDARKAHSPKLRATKGVIVIKKLVTFAIILFSLAAILTLAGCFGTTTAPATATTTTTSSSGGGFDWTLIIFLVVIFALMYFLMIRPQRNRQKQAQKMMQALQRGDQVVTTSGIYGTIELIDETSFVLKLEDGAKIRVVKNAVAGKRQDTP